MIYDVLSALHLTSFGAIALFLAQSSAAATLIVIILSKLRRTTLETRFAIRTAFLLMFISSCLILGAPIIPLIQQDLIPKEFQIQLWLPGRTPPEFWLSFVFATLSLQVATLWDDTTADQYATLCRRDRRTSDRRISNRSEEAARSATDKVIT